MKHSSGIKVGHERRYMVKNLDQSKPTYPRASTFENAVVGVTGVPTPMNERVRPCSRKLETLGVLAPKNGIGELILDNVMVDGVLVVVVGDGGNTNNVCEGVEMAGGGTVECWCAGFTFFSKLLREVSGGGGSFRGAARARGVEEHEDNVICVPGFD